MMGKEKIVAVIPARMGASRFPGKPLVKILDLPMIEHVRRRVELCKRVDEVYVATCDQEIMDIVERHGGKAVMTAKTHERCTDRVEEAVQEIEADIVLIFQGDEPLFDPQVTDLLLKPMDEDDGVLCTNLISLIKNKDDVSDTSIVKTVLDLKDNVIYFSRASIPFLRVDHGPAFYRQTGLSAFRKSFLIKFSHLCQTPLEKTESVDFLRILEHGYSIRGVVVDQELFGVDEPEHVARIEKILQEDKIQAGLYQEILKS